MVQSKLLAWDSGGNVFENGNMPEAQEVKLSR